MNIALIPGLATVGATELIVILTIVLLIFGAKKIPELARGLGSGVREFKGGISGEIEKKDSMEQREETTELSAEETVRTGR